MNTTPHKWSGVLRKLKAFDDHPEVWRNNIRGGSFRPCSAYNLWWITVSVVEVSGLKQLPNSWASAECFLTHRAPKVTITSQTLATTTTKSGKRKNKCSVIRGSRSLSLSLPVYRECRKTMKHAGRWIKCVRASATIFLYSADDTAYVERTRGQVI